MCYVPKRDHCKKREELKMTIKDVTNDDATQKQFLYNHCERIPIELVATERERCNKMQQRQQKQKQKTGAAM